MCVCCHKKIITLSAGGAGDCVDFPGIGVRAQPQCERARVLSSSAFQSDMIDDEFMVSEETSGLNSKS